ncbi:hypothetical protein WN48_04837 [Eufriesea mexicana]|uniref:Uncharacterized protein n=1 Tax=Eufriesea mexicana TaxID=516756 RepID=A0A310S9Q2_9HYME|nr:hypothetical protein WN48_04837 [Eufriesea mexicana]
MAARKKAGDPGGPGELSMEEDRQAERWKQLKAARKNVKEAERPRSRGEIEVEEIDTSFGEDRVTESCRSPRGSYHWKAKDRPSRRTGTPDNHPAYEKTGNSVTERMEGSFSADPKSRNLANFARSVRVRFNRSADVISGVRSSPRYANRDGPVEQVSRGVGDDDDGDYAMAFERGELDELRSESRADPSVDAALETLASAVRPIYRSRGQCEAQPGSGSGETRYRGKDKTVSRQRACRKFRAPRGVLSQHYKAVHASCAGQRADEQLLFHLFDILFKCSTCRDVQIPRDKPANVSCFHDDIAISRGPLRGSLQQAFRHTLLANASDSIDVIEDQRRTYHDQAN